MSSPIINSKTVARRVTAHYTIDQDLDSTLYASVLANSTLVPANSFVTLISSADVKTTRLVGNADSTFANAEALTVAGKAQIAALSTTAVADATDLASAVTLVNALKVKVNAIITALKS